MPHALSKHRLSLQGAIAILLVCYISSGLSSFTYGLGQDGWLAQLTGFLLIAPLFLLFARLARILPGKHLYDMLEYAFGSWIGRFLSLLYFLYFLHLAVTVQGQYAAFIQLTTLVNTPRIALLLACFALYAYLAKSGLETLGKWSLLLAVLAAVMALGLTLLAIPHMEGGRLLPMGESPPAAILRGGGHFAISPLGEAVVILALLGHLDKGASPYKLFYFGGMFALGFFLLTFFRDTAILGPSFLEMLHYPSHKAASVMQIGPFGGGMEVFLSGTMLLTGLTKVALCLLAAARALRRIKENPLLFPLAVISLVLSAIVSSNPARALTAPAAHIFYGPLLQGGIPGILWLVAEIKTRRRTNLESGA